MPYFKNDNVNILFIHIPKTGGTSLENYFSKKYNIDLNAKSLFMYLCDKQKITNNILINSSLQHMKYIDIFNYKDFFRINFDNIKIITIVRNPYERIISDLFHFKFINVNTTQDEVFYIINKYLYDTNLDNHNIPQYLFITNSNCDLVSNIYILHTETLISDMHGLGYTDFNIYENVNENKHNINYYSYLNNDSIKLINDFYDYDFILFNYPKKMVF
jgi:hypothetical protein